MRFDRERLATLGLTVGEVASVVRTKVQGTVATDIHRDDRNIDIRLQAVEEARDSVADLLALSIHQQGKTAIPLAAALEAMAMPRTSTGGSAASVRRWRRRSRA